MRKDLIHLPNPSIDPPSFFMMNILLLSLLVVTATGTHTRRRGGTKAVAFKCKDGEYRESLRDITSTKSSKKLMKFSESISAEMGRYEQISRQQSHRYALAMGSINGKLAVLDDPTRAESYLRDSLQRSKNDVKRSSKTLEDARKKLELVHTRVEAGSKDMHHQVSNELKALVAIREARAAEAKVAYQASLDDVTNWEAALSSFEEGCSDDTSLNDCVSQMMKDLPGGAGALVKVVTKLHAVRESINNEMMQHRQAVEGCLSSLTDISSDADELRITYESRSGSKLGLSNIQSAMEAQRAQVEGTSAGEEEKSIKSIVEGQQGGKDILPHTSIGDHSQNSNDASKIQSEAIHQMVGGMTGSSFVGGTGATGAAQTHEIAANAETNLSMPAAYDTPSNVDASLKEEEDVEINMEAKKEAELIDHSDEDDKLEEEMEAKQSAKDGQQSHYYPSSAATQAIAQADALKREAEKEAEDTEASSKKLRLSASQAMKNYMEKMRKEQIAMKLKHDTFQNDLEKKEKAMKEEEKKLTERIFSERLQEQRLREESSELLSNSKHDAVAQAVAITNAAQITASKIRTEATQQASKTITEAQVQAKDLQFKLSKMIQTFQKVSTLSDIMAKHNAEDAVQHRAVVRKQEADAARRLRKAADAVTQASRTAATIVADARSLARHDQEKDAKRRLEYVTIAENNLRDAFMPSFTKYEESVVSDVEESVIQAQVNIQPTCNIVGTERAKAAAGIESAARSLKAAAANVDVCQHAYDKTFPRVIRLEKMEEEISTEIQSINQSPLNVSISGDEEEEVTALQESNNHLDRLHAEIMDVRMRVKLARLVQHKRKIALTAAEARLRISERMNYELQHAAEIVHTKTEEQYYHASQVVSKSFIVPRADVKRLDVASASYIDRLLSLRNSKFFFFSKIIFEKIIFSHS
jgi:hypothetical protein